MLINLPQHVAEKSAGLGEPLAHFETSRTQMLLWLLFSGPIMLLGAGMIVGAIILMFTGDPKLKGLLAFKLCFAGIVLGVGLIVMGIGMVVRRRSLRGAGVFVFAEGFVRHDRAGAESMRWDRLREIRRGLLHSATDLVLITPWGIALTDDAGREWVFTDTLTGVKAFREIAEDRTLPHLLPDLLDGILDGQAVPFGDITVTEQGLGCPRQPFLPWDRVTAGGVEEEKVVIRSAHQKEPYCRLEMHTVPNLHLLLAVVEQFRRGA